MSGYAPRPGDLIWTDFSPTIGREQSGRRPALVLSSAGLHENAGFLIIAPITSRVRPFPTSVVLPQGSAIEGEVLLHQIRSIDALARPVKFIGHVDGATAARIRERLATMIAI